MHYYGCSLREVSEWTIPQALEFGKQAAIASNEERAMRLSDMAVAYSATQSADGNKAFRTLLRELTNTNEKQPQPAEKQPVSFSSLMSKVKDGERS